MQTRRDLLRSAMCSPLLLGGLNNLVFANSSTRARFVFIILRGAMDGLAAVPAIGDRHYQKQRGTLALGRPGASDGSLELDGFFALHPAFPVLHSLYQAGELLPIQAVASSYRERSHFDAQKQLENGTNHPAGRRDGWLNRSLKFLSASQQSGIALAQNVPLLLQGEQSVSSWSPAVLPEADADTLLRISELYQDDSFLSLQFENAMRTRAMVDELGNEGVTMGTQSIQTEYSASG